MAYTTLDLPGNIFYKILEWTNNLSLQASMYHQWRIPVTQSRNQIVACTDTQTPPVPTLADAQEHSTCAPDDYFQECSVCWQNHLVGLFLAHHPSNVLLHWALYSSLAVKIPVKHTQFSGKKYTDSEKKTFYALQILNVLDIDTQVNFTNWLRWARHAAHTCEMRNINNIFDGQPKRKDHWGKPVYRGG